MADIGKTVHLASQKYDGQTVVFVTDFHPLADIHHAFSIELVKELKSKGVNSIGFEFLGQLEKPLIEALANKMITKDEFLEIVIPKDAPMVGGSMVSHIGYDATKTLYSDIADLVLSGTKVHCLGTSQGINSFTIKPEDAEWMDNFQLRSGMHIVEDIKNRKSLENLSSEELKNLFEQQIKEIESKFDSLTEMQKEHFVSTVQDIRSKEESGKPTAADYKDACLDLIRAQSSLFDSILKDAQEILKRIENNKGIVGGEMDRVNTDGLISRKVIEAVSESGPIVIVNGDLHSHHKKDIDNHLRQQGFRTLIFDLDIGEENLCGKPLSVSCDEVKRLTRLREVFSRMDGDPDRFSINITNKGVESIEPLKPWTTFDQILWSIGITR